MRKIEKPEIFRAGVQKKLLELIKGENLLDIDEKNSKNLEKGIFNFALKEATARKVLKKWDNSYFVQIYIDRLKSVYINLKNEKLIEDLKSGEIKPHIIAFMTHQEMKPKKWEALIIEKTKRDKNKFESKIEASTDTFTCSKCRSKKCTYYAQQVRSSDEPMTLFVTCLNCDKKWKC